MHASFPAFVMLAATLQSQNLISGEFSEGEYTFCRVRMHYGHPDVFDRIFHITRGGISKASRVINISEDIYAG